MNNRRSQRGITFIGFCIVMGLIAFFVGLTLKLYPLYYEKFQIKSAMESVVVRPDAADLSPAEVRKFFMKNIALTNIKRFSGGDKVVRQYVKIIKGKKGEPNKIRVEYEARNNAFKDLWFVLEFSEEMPLGD